MPHLPVRVFEFASSAPSHQLALSVRAVPGTAPPHAPTWYVGQVSMLCGAADFGGDGGLGLGLAFAAVPYSGLRALERLVDGYGVVR
ncbi:hypothetical protein DL769_006555 [Monosporascus sp. CRB-8-3]|nr:hypothetical protein DL769_006555 [Monosporascus sp. CRB-8-3]